MEEEIPSQLLNQYLQNLVSATFLEMEKDIYERFGTTIIRKFYKRFSQYEIPDTLVSPLLTELKLYGYDRLSERTIQLNGENIIVRIYYDVSGQYIDDATLFLFMTQYRNHRDTQRLRKDIMDFLDSHSILPTPEECKLIQDPVEFLNCVLTHSAMQH